MCGRFVQDAKALAFYEELGVEVPAEFSPSYNIAPSATVGVVTWSGSHPEFQPMRWGLVPSWAKDEKIGNRMINARSETVFEKPSFRSAIKKRRCLVPCSGYYEWQNSEQGKVPHYIFSDEGKPFCLGGIWEEWKKSKVPLYTFSLLTQNPIKRLQSIHDRMPVILKRDQWQTWLDPNKDIKPLLTEPQYSHLDHHVVDRKVNNPRFNQPECIEPI